jgi:hypothetical protein
MNGDTEDEENGDSLKAFYMYKNTFDKDQIWVGVPQRRKLFIMQLIVVTTKSP